MPHATIVYYGPGMAGKSTNLQSLARTWLAEARGELRSEGIATYRRVSLDLLVPSAQTNRRLSLTLVTTPGCILYDHDRTSTLKTADGVVFVADSQKNKLEENLKHLRELAFMLIQYRRDTSLIPIVMQYNKRDVPAALDLPTLQHYLNQHGWPVIEAVAIRNVGVIETLRAICTAIEHRRAR
ncbi:MAG: GTPase domain-containing protein [Roseiflexaceae bacterium]